MGHKATIFVPVFNDRLTAKMRRILSREEMDELIQAIPRGDSIWIDNEMQRRDAYKAILARGDRAELMGMIKALYRHQQGQLAKGRKLHATDERFYRDAEKMLYDEIAMVLHIKPEQVVSYIQSQMPSADGEKEETLV